MMDEKNARWWKRKTLDQIWENNTQIALAGQVYNYWSKYDIPLKYSLPPSHSISSEPTYIAMTDVKDPASENKILEKGLISENRGANFVTACENQM